MPSKSLVPWGKNEIKINYTDLAVNTNSPLTTPSSENSSGVKGVLSKLVHATDVTTKHEQIPTQKKMDPDLQAQIELETIKLQKFKMTLIFHWVCIFIIGVLLLVNLQFFAILGFLAYLASQFFKYKHKELDKPQPTPPPQQTIVQPVQNVYGGLPPYPYSHVSTSHHSDGSVFTCARTDQPVKHLHVTTSNSPTVSDFTLGVVALWGLGVTLFVWTFLPLIIAVVGIFLVKVLKDISR